MDRYRVALVVILAVTVGVLSIGVLGKGGQNFGGWYGYTPRLKSNECYRLDTFDKVPCPPGIRP